MLLITFMSKQLNETSSKMQQNELVSNCRIMLKNLLQITWNRKWSLNTQRQNPMKEQKSKLNETTYVCFEEYSRASSFPNSKRNSSLNLESSLFTNNK